MKEECSSTLVGDGPTPVLHNKKPNRHHEIGPGRPGPTRWAGRAFGLGWAPLDLQALSGKIMGPGLGPTHLTSHHVNKAGRPKITLKE